MPHVLVIGSVNMDLVITAEAFARAGETLTAQSFATYHGGKGANQAVAAARLGAKVSLLGCIGDDAFGVELRAGLEQEGIHTRWLRTASQTRTGVAGITVCQAENAILVVPGANHAITVEDVLSADEAFAQADVVLAQLEVPMPVVLAAAERAHMHGKPFLLNPAPAVELSADLLKLVTLITPNEHELGITLGQPGGYQQDLLARLPGRVLMTCGKTGATYTCPEGNLLHQNGFNVQAIDTTGAGDTFNGALAAFWHLGVEAAMRHACAAAAISVTKAGARAGMPTRAELDAFLAQRTA